MDKAKNRWAWLPEQMPGVARLMAEKRRELGKEHVAECWKRSVVDGEPGWFFAGEGALMVGTLWDDPEIQAFLTARITRTQAMVVIRRPGGGA